jgi:hypothetical protein
MAEVRETVELSFAEGMLSDIAGDVFEDSPEQVVPVGRLLVYLALIALSFVFVLFNAIVD